MKFLIPALLIVAILYIGRAIILPFLIALFLWYLLNSIATYYRKALPCRENCPPAKDWAMGALSWAGAAATFIGFVWFFITRIRPAIGGFMAQIPQIQERIYAMKGFVSDTIGIEIGMHMVPDTAAIVSAITSSTAQIMTAMGLVFIYAFFMLIEQSTFPKKLARLFPTKRDLEKTRVIIKAIDDNMKRYMFMKTALSALNATLSYLFMICVGFEFAFVWAFIIFVLNYIPTFGTIVSLALPVMFAFIVGHEPYQILVLAAGLMVVQGFVGNILDPKLIGRTLNMSMLAIIINLVFWGILWGPVGMFFSVPILAAIYVSTAQFDKTRWIAILLSANGEIPDKKEK